MFTDTDVRSPWKKRAERVGFKIWQGKRLQDMTDAEIEAAFDGFAECAGVHYIPRVPRGIRKQ